MNFQERSDINTITLYFQAVCETRTVSHSEDDHHSKSPKKDLRKALQQWALETNSTHNAIDKMLKIWREHGHTEVPCTARTLLGTQKIEKPSHLSGGQYHYFGLKAHLQKIMLLNPSATTLDLVLNIDGLPVSKSGSSKTSLWPVLFRLLNIPNSGVFPIALCLTSAKPDNLEFLEDAISEIASLSKEGIEFDGKAISVNLVQVVCDAPARAMCKGIKYFSGYHGCDQCDILGEYDRQHKKITYPDKENSLHPRTNESFRAKADPGHHVADTPFTKLENLDMVEHFPIDYMHQVLLGVQKKLLLMWVSEKKGTGKLRAGEIDLVNERLVQLSPQTPKEFARKPRSTKHLKNFKATEFRLFLIYTGKIVMKGVLSADRYKHFLCLSVAITILLNSSLSAKYASYAHELLVYFVSSMDRIYGRQHMVYNVHSLLHLAKQTPLYGNLNNSSAFQFENHMQSFKKLIRQRRDPLVEIVARLKELDKMDNIRISASTVLQLSVKPPDNVYITVEDDIVELLRIKFKDSATVIKPTRYYVCRKYLEKTDYFTSPCPSSVVGIYRVDRRYTCLVEIEESMLAKRCFKMNAGNAIVVQTLLHNQ